MSEELQRSPEGLHDGVDVVEWLFARERTRWWRKHRWFRVLIWTTVGSTVLFLIYDLSSHVARLVDAYLGIDAVSFLQFHGVLLPFVNYVGLVVLLTYLCAPIMIARLLASLPRAIDHPQAFSAASGVTYLRAFRWTVWPWLALIALLFLTPLIGSLLKAVLSAALAPTYIWHWTEPLHHLNIRSTTFDVASLFKFFVTVLFAECLVYLKVRFEEKNFALVAIIVGALLTVIYWGGLEIIIYYAVMSRSYSMQLIYFWSLTALSATTLAGVVLVFGANNRRAVHAISLPSP